jgi:hypothetical protein
MKNFTRNMMVSLDTRVGCALATQKNGEREYSKKYMVQTWGGTFWYFGDIPKDEKVVLFARVERVSP